MTRSKTATLDAELIARKGEAAPARVSVPERTPASGVPRGTKNTVAVTVRLDEERYRRLVGYGAQFTPRKTNQEILVEALDAYLVRVEEERQ
jgi:hypothetical protein